MRLAVNIDHIATIREARKSDEPDPVAAAAICELAGAQGITVHLRGDRRHIQDHDVERIKQSCHVKLNLEMAATDEMVAVAGKIKPHMAMLVPEGRTEVTTEGGLDIAGQFNRLSDVVKRLAIAHPGVRFSLMSDQGGGFDYAPAQGNDAPTRRLADVLGRIVVSPQELQVGVVTAFVGAPLFIALVRRRRIAHL